MLKIEESIREKDDWFYSHSYRVHQDGIDITLAADTAAIRSALDLGMLESKSKKLSSYITPEMLGYLRKYKFNYYIEKCGRTFHMCYSGNFFRINVDGRSLKMYPDDDTYDIYEKINDEWRLI